jgi:hypothetical protein
MIHQTEAKPQTWRALVIFKDGSECLLYVGRSTTHVRAGYGSAYEELLDDEERARVESISLQCWDGAPDRGRWIPKTPLAIPKAKPPVRLAAANGLDDGNEKVEGDEALTRVLSFKKRALSA